MGAVLFAGNISMTYMRLSPGLHSPAKEMPRYSSQRKIAAASVANATAASIPSGGAQCSWEL